jgi:hypothetical protein
MKIVQRKLGVLIVIQNLSHLQHPEIERSISINPPVRLAHGHKVRCFGDALRRFIQFACFGIFKTKISLLDDLVGDLTYDLFRVILALGIKVGAIKKGKD